MLFGPQMGDFVLFSSLFFFFCPNLCTNVLAVVQEATEPPYVMSRFTISAFLPAELSEVFCKQGVSGENF